MTKADWRIGESYPLDYSRRPLSDETDPTWYILTTPPQREVSAVAWLAVIGVAETWYPTETAWKPVRGARRKVEYERRIAPGYIFAEFDREPVWDVLFMMGRGRVSGVVGRDGMPMPIDTSVLAKMQQVPQRITRLRDEEVNRERAARLALSPAQGEAAVIKDGPLSGFVVDVQRIDRGIAYFLLNGMPVQATVGSMERLARAGKSG